MTHTHYRSTNRKKHPAETAAAAARDRAAARGTATVVRDRVVGSDAAAPETAAATPPLPVNPIAWVFVASTEADPKPKPKRCGRPRKADNEAPSSKSNAWYYKNRDKASADAKRRYALVKDDPAYIERRKQRVNRRYRENAGGLRDKIHARNRTPHTGTRSIGRRPRGLAAHSRSHVSSLTQCSLPPLVLTAVRRVSIPRLWALTASTILSGTSQKTAARVARHATT